MCRSVGNRVSAKNAIIKGCVTVVFLLGGVVSIYPVPASAGSGVSSAMMFCPHGHTVKSTSAQAQTTPNQTIQSETIAQYADGEQSIIASDRSDATLSGLLDK